MKETRSMPQREEILMKVAAFAADAHEGQVRKYVNEPYIEHPVRVMYNCMSYHLATTVLSAALLHDVIEDTKVTQDELQTFLRGIFLHEDANLVSLLVIQLTDVYIKKDYPHWNRRIRKAAELERLKTISADAQTIKYADILDNADAIVDEDAGFAKILLEEYHRQLSELTKGNASLRQIALEKVKEGLLRLSIFET